MRLVIDLQAYQSGAASRHRKLLAQARELALSAGQHTVFVLLHGLMRDTLEEARNAFNGVLPPAQLCVFDAPPGASDWVLRSAELMRDAFLAGLRPDLVFTPGLFERPAAPVLCSGAELAGVHAAFSFDDVREVLALNSSESELNALSWRRRKMLRQAAVLAAAPDEDCAELRAAFPAAIVCRGDSAPALWQAFEAAMAHPAPAAAAPEGKPRLAYISPLPPQKSGIADYSIELLHQLQAFYDIELVCDTAGSVSTMGSGTNVDTSPAAGLPWPLLSVQEFEDSAHRFDRVLYHFGNNGVHNHMFELLRRQPGIVVLHDFFLSGVLDNMERDGYLRQAYLHALYESHGYTALLDHERIGRNPSIWKYPCNKGVLDNADGVIVHSEFSRQLARQWYGDDAADAWRTLPLIRGLPQGMDRASARDAARAALGVQDGDFVICSFGMMGVTKLNERLLEAFLDSPLAQDAQCRLVFVGEGDGGDYGRRIAERIASSPAGSRVTVTGFATAEDYARWLSASDAAVQLRNQTRGETSASVLDCLLYGVPTIINAHGSSASLPDELLVKLPDECTADELAQALLTLRRDPAQAAALSQRAVAFMDREHAPQRVGEVFHEAIEDFAQRSPAAQYRRLLAQIAALPNGSTAELSAAASAIAANMLPKAPKPALVDISALVQTDLKTGIQRVVRSILLAMIAEPAAGLPHRTRVQRRRQPPLPLRAPLTWKMLGAGALALEDAPVEVRRATSSSASTCSPTAPRRTRTLLTDMRHHGVEIYFVVYDLLPVLLPDAFPFGAEGYFGDYLRHHRRRVADGLVCISRAVADELHDWLEQRPRPPRRRRSSWATSTSAPTSTPAPQASACRRMRNRCWPPSPASKPADGGHHRAAQGPGPGAGGLRPAVARQCGRQPGHRRQAGLDGGSAGQAHPAAPGTGQAPVLAGRRVRRNAAQAVPVLLRAAGSIGGRRLRPAADRSGAARPARHRARYPGVPRSGRRTCLVL
jgi:glycosyltransferase involved in cell wall biosynthesis